MHKLHNRASTSIQKSRDKISNITSALDNDSHKIDLFEEMKTFKRTKGISSTRNKL